jgi:hypothetical protein
MVLEGFCGLGLRSFFYTLRSLNRKSLVVIVEFYLKFDVVVVIDYFVIGFLKAWLESEPEN